MRSHAELFALRCLNGKLFTWLLIQLGFFLFVWCFFLLCPLPFCLHWATLYFMLPPCTLCFCRPSQLCGRTLINTSNIKMGKDRKVEKGRWVSFSFTHHWPAYYCVEMPQENSFSPQWYLFFKINMNKLQLTVVYFAQLPHLFNHIF